MNFLFLTKAINGRGGSSKRSVPFWKRLARLLPEKGVVSGKEIQKLVHKQEQMQ